MPEIVLVLMQVMKRYQNLLLASVISDAKVLEFSIVIPRRENIFGFMILSMIDADVMKLVLGSSSLAEKMQDQGNLFGSSFVQEVFNSGKNWNLRWFLYFVSYFVGL